MSDSEDAAPDIPENITPGNAERGREMIEQFLDEHPGPSGCDEDILRQMHHDEDLSPPQITDRLYADSATIRNWLRKHDLYREPEEYHPVYQDGKTDD